MYVFSSIQSAQAAGFKVSHYDEEYRLYVVVACRTRRAQRENALAFARPYTAGEHAR